MEQQFQLQYRQHLARGRDGKGERFNQQLGNAYDPNAGQQYGGL